MNGRTVEFPSPSRLILVYKIEVCLEGNDHPRTIPMLENKRRLYLTDTFGAEPLCLLVVRVPVGATLT